VHGRGVTVTAGRLTFAGALPAEGATPRPTRRRRGVVARSKRASLAQELFAVDSLLKLLDVTRGDPTRGEVLFPGVHYGGDLLHLKCGLARAQAERLAARRSNKANAG